MQEVQDQVSYTEAEIEEWLEGWLKVLRRLARERNVPAQVGNSGEVRFAGQSAMIQLLLEDLREGEL